MQLLHGWPTAFAAGAILALSFVVARRLRAGWPAGPVYGFLALVASTDLALFLLRATALPARLLPVLGVGGALGLIEIIRLARPSEPEERSSATRPPAQLWLYWTLVGLLALNVHFVRTTWLGPVAGQTFFQAWNPQYVDASYAAGRFLRDTDMALGRGVMSSTMYTAPNTLGLVALLRGLGLPDAHAAFNGATVLCVVLTGTLLLTSLKRDWLAMLVYAVLLSVYTISEQRLVLVFADGWGDEILFLAGAFVCYQIFRGGTEASGAARWHDAALASTFLVFGRNYGAYFAFVILALCTWRLRGTPRVSRRQLGAAWMLFLAFSAHEVWLVLAGGSLFYPRVSLLSAYPFTLWKLVLGTAVDWGIVAPAERPLLPSGDGLWLVGLAVALWARWVDRRHRPVGVVSLLAPLLCLVLPLSLELATQYRKMLYSRLYIPSVWFHTWYPAYLLSRIAARPAPASHPGMGSSRLGRPARWALVGCYALIVGALLYHGYPGFNSVAYVKTRYAARFFGSPWMETDGAMAKTIRAGLAPDEFASLRGTRILYFHHEPGIGLRYYMGGNLFQDYDFWSDPVQSHIDADTTLEGLLRALDAPNLYLSYGPVPVYQAHVAYPPRPAIWSDLARIDRLPYVRRVFRIGAPGEVAAFAQIDRERLGLSTSGTEAGR